jgi:hypothetical protein
MLASEFQLTFCNHLLVVESKQHARWIVKKQNTINEGNEMWRIFCKRINTDRDTSLVGTTIP